LLEARKRAERALDLDTPLFDQARHRLFVGLRRKVLGDLPARAEEGALVEVWNRLWKTAPRRYAIVLEALDAADDATIEVLQRIGRRPGCLKPPLVLEFRTTEPSPSASKLLDVLVPAAGPEAVLRASPPPIEAAPEKIDLLALPPDVLRVLRAGALM